MWSLPELTPQNVEHIDGYFRADSIWAILLFRKAERSVLSGLERNWHLFSEALGPQAHVITLLQQKSTTSGVKLSYPDNYEKLIGTFCNELGIPVDALPALVILNATEGPTKGPPYWSFAGDPKRGSDMLMSVVSDIQSATFNIPRDVPLEKWRQIAISRLFQRASGRFAQKVASNHAKNVIPAVKSIISRLTFSSR